MPDLSPPPSPTYPGNTRVSSGTYLTSFVGRGLRTQETVRVRTAWLPNRCRLKAGSAATRVGQVPPAVRPAREWGTLPVVWELVPLCQSVCWVRGIRGSVSLSACELFVGVGVPLRATVALGAPLLPRATSARPESSLRNARSVRGTALEGSPLTPELEAAA